MGDILTSSPFGLVLWFLDIGAIIMGIVVLWLMFRIASTPLVRRYPRYHQGRVLSTILFVLSFLASIFGRMMENEFLTEEVHHLLLFLMSFSFIYTYMAYKKEIEADEKLRGLVE